MQVDLLNPVAIDEQFDLIWCFGVLHHTGDTYRAYKHIAHLAKSGGFMFMMIYGEPRNASEYGEINLYEKWRRKTKNLDLLGRYEAIREGLRKGEFPVSGEKYAHGYFDAISPAINDLYTFEELEGWMLKEGYHSIKRTLDNRNIFIVGQKGST